MAQSYRLETASPAIARTFSADAGPDPWRGGTVATGQFAPVIVRAGKSSRRVIRPMHWGYPPPGQPAESLSLGKPHWVAAVRNLESPFWIGNLRHSALRCLIPATHFASGTGAKDRRWFRVRDEAVFAIAGIWRDLTDMPVFAMLVTEPSPALLPVEGKGGSTSMPLILRGADQERWLTGDWKRAQALVRPLPSALLLEVGETG
jgi:putative SOS response-associated peptidase YedK